MVKNPGRIKRGTRSYNLLRLLSDIGGKATREEINKHLPKYWDLSEEDKEIEVGVGKPKFWHRSSAICQNFKVRGYLENPKRGVWKITDAGKQRIVDSGQDTNLPKNNASPEKERERDIEDSLARNPDLLEEGLVVVKSQYPTDTGGKIDILCQDKNRNYVVVELKKRLGSDIVVGQIQRYMAEVEKEDPNVRGFIVVSKGEDKDIKLHYALEGSRFKDRIIIKPFGPEPPTRENIKYCDQCGEPNRKSAKFCTACKERFWL